MNAGSACLICLIASVNPMAARAQNPATVISHGKPVEIAASAARDQATVFVFYKPASTLEAAFVDKLKTTAGAKVAVRLIALSTGEEPIARKYEILRTPTAMVLDRRGRVTGRSSDAAEIAAAMRKAAGVMRIDWAEEGTELFEEADAAAGGKGLKPGIMRTMSLQPEWLKYFYAMTRKAHFEDSALTRREKEMIATYVSGLNRCKF